MAQARNTFVKSKMNKDLDARLLPPGEYRDARNIQVSRSEGATVGSLENILGNEAVLNIDILTSSVLQKCIGYVTDEANSHVYLFITDNVANAGFDTGGKNFIIRYDSTNTGQASGIILVSGAFLNFDPAFPIYGVNLLEGLLFWTDNKNQPRVINVITAASNNTYYSSEDQISVAKYNPYQAIELWQEVDPVTSPATYETTMQDVTTPYLPNGGSAVNPTAFAGGVAFIVVNQFENNIIQSAIGTGSTISYINGAGNMVSTGTTVAGFIYVVPTTPSPIPDPPYWTVTASSNLPVLPVNTTLVFNPNPYYDGQFAGDPNYLEDKFVRFSYRFKFDDNQYSIFAPFTQIAFIPKQDGYFLYVKDDTLNYPETTDQDAAYRSTVVSFMENKVDLVKLRIPLPFSKSTLLDDLKVTEMDILYKESNGLAVKVIDTITITDIEAQTVEPNVFTYDYISKKPYKTLPADNLIRVYDKIPVKALSQEIASNRVIYGNFQDKHTPPATLDYSVNSGAKADFDLNIITADNDPDFGIITAGTNIRIQNATGTPEVGSIATGAGIPAETSVVSATTTIITLNKDTTAAFILNTTITFNLVGPDTNTVTKIEYPNSTLKQNRNYQVGVMLSDRYGRTSTVVLSSNKEEVITTNGTFIGDTIYSPYLAESIRTDQWPGDSLKVLFNQPIGPSSPDLSTGWPGIYNGDLTSSLYNPLGWYSYKIVVKQTEQEYYNVYLPGIMASYPEEISLELGQTSHVVLINDNINKVPRDLTEVGPQQKQFRSSVKLWGRVNNTTTVITYDPTDGDYTNIAESNAQYYPNRGDDVVSTISTIGDLFDYLPSEAPQPDYFPQFYLYESNPLIARLSTEKQIGQIATTNYSPVSGEVAINSTSDEIFLKNIVGDTAGIALGDTVSGTGLPADIIVVTPGFTDAVTAVSPDPTTTAVSTSNIIVLNSVTSIEGNQYVSGLGIPEGTIVESVNGLNVTLSNVVNIGNNVPVDFKTPAKIKVGRLDDSATPVPVAAPVTVSFDTLITIVNSETPGLQYLAVMETEAVDSLLDIFWETTTTGIISDLNTLILNASDGAANFSSFDTSTFKEDLASGTNILNANFTLVDLFGAVIPSGNITSFTLDSVTNSNGTLVSYFTLVDLGTGYYNVATTAAYYSAVFYGNNANLRTFTLTFTSDITSGTDVTTTSYNETISLRNVDPSITTATPASGTTIQTNRYETTLATLDGVNGANNTTLRTQDLTWEILSVFNTAGSSPTTDIGPNGTNLGYFSLPTSIIPNPTNQKRAVLTNNSGGNMPPDIYNINLRLVDALNSVSATYTIDMQIIPDVVRELTWQIVCDGEQQADNFPAVEIEITDGSASPTQQNGWYIFPSTWGYLTQQFGGSVITIDRTNAQLTSAGDCPDPFPITPYFSPTSSAAVRLLWTNGDCTCTGTSGSITQSSNVDITGYQFEIT